MTHTMELELNRAAEEGFRFQSAMGGETANGGNEVVVVMARRAGDRPRVAYRLLATTKTSTLEKELQQTGAAGYEILGMTVAKTAFGGKELVAILRRIEDR